MLHLVDDFLLNTPIGQAVAASMLVAICAYVLKMIGNRLRSFAFSVSKFYAVALSIDAQLRDINHTQHAIVRLIGNLHCLKLQDHTNATADLFEKDTSL